MRIATLATFPLILGAMIALPAQAPAQVSLSVSFGTRLGPEIGVFAYSADRDGDWHDRYRQWTPVTLYDVNGRYYTGNVNGARAIQVYRYNNEYFFPPQDQDWAQRDNRYNYRRQPNNDDYGRARQWAPHPDLDPRLGAEVGVLQYSSERAGDWRRNSRRWTPVVMYEVNGRYYQHNGNGARPVSMYRYRNEYFLPPTDQDWVNSDRRFNYGHQPNNDDRGRARSRP